MKGFRLILFGLISLTACGQRHEGEKKTGLLSHLVSITDNEDKGVKEILAFYNGQCEYSVGTTASADKGTRKYFELEMSQSELLEQYAKVIELPASNIAFIFYKNLKSEKSNYSDIKVVIKLKDGKSDHFEYSMSQLEIVNQKHNILNKVSDLIQAKDYNTLFKLFDLSVPDLNAKKLEDLCSKIDSKYGSIVKVQFQGFSFFKNSYNPKGKELLHLAGFQQRDNQNIPLSVFVDFKKTDMEGSIYTLKFGF